MVNKYINTKEIVEEYQEAWWSNRYKKEIVIMSIVLIIGIIMIVTQFIQDDLRIMSWVAFIVLPIMYLPMYFYKKKIAFKLEKERFDKIYKEAKNTEIKIRFDDIIKMTTNNNTIEVPYQKIKKYIETKNLIVLLLKGDMTIAVKKDAFVNGTEEEFKEMLKNKLKNNKKGAKKCIKHGKN